MHILFTGASSFTGMWFVDELVKAGHQVTSIIRNPRSTYSALRLQRIDKLPSEVIEDCTFGSDTFIKLIKRQKWDLLCHHAADVTNYKSPDFDPVAALENNTYRLKDVLNALKEQSCNRILLTGSVFEQGEGAGSDHLRAVSPYGLSKGLTSEMFRFYCTINQFKLGKFIIPNPFGPFEEVRFTSFLMQNWFAEKNVFVSMPSFVRDNIHVSLLAKAYRDFAESLTLTPGFEKVNPSGYPESQGAFTSRFAQEMRNRLNLTCTFELGIQKEFSEPKVRLNTDLLDADKLGWDESSAWDELALYYESIYKPALAL